MNTLLNGFKMAKTRWVFLLCAAFSVSALAAKPDNTELLEEVQPPPKIQSGEPLPDDEPQITIRKKGKETIEEYRMHGEIYMLKVTPEHGVPYYLRKEDQDGGWVNVGPNPPLAVPKWIIFHF